MPLPRSLRRGLAGPFLLLAGCSAWTPISGPIPAAIAGRQAETLRARDGAGRAMVGIGAAIRDSLLLLDGPGGVRDSMPVAEVVQVEHCAYSPRRTLALVGLGAMALVIHEIVTARIHFPGDQATP